MVITTGVGAPFSRFCVWALNALQNSMMLRPRWPSAGPIGGDGFAAPAGTCSFKYPVIFFAIAYSCWCRWRSAFQVRGAEATVGGRPLLPRFLRRVGQIRPLERCLVG